jgi:hypothetical protein
MQHLVHRSQSRYKMMMIPYGCIVGKRLGTTVRWEWFTQSMRMSPEKFHLVSFLIPFRPPQGNTIDAFRDRAKSPNAITPSISPPGGVPLEGKHKGVRKTKVDVGVGTDLMFNSNNITEPPGTVIEFSFNPKVFSIPVLLILTTKLCRITPSYKVLSRTLAIPKRAAVSPAVLSPLLYLHQGLLSRSKSLI